MKVVIVDEELPFPATSGKRIRTLNLVTQLAKRHRIAYICYRNSDATEARQALEFFRDQGIDLVTVNRTSPPKSALRRDPAFYLGLARNLVSSLPYLVAINDSRQMRHAVRQYARTHAVDLWQCEWTPYFQAVRGLAGARVVIMAHNVESLIWQRYFEMETDPVKRWYIGLQWRKMERFETDAFSRVTRVITVSQDDAQLVRQRFGRSQVDVVDNGVDTAYFRASDQQREPRTILFLGSLDWRPNLDAVRILIDAIFPQVLLEVPQAQLLVVGRNPPPWLEQLAKSRAGVQLHANVPDVRPYLSRCAVLAVPLRIGGGSRLKILEALSMATPVVSTPIGAEGLQLIPGDHYVESNLGEDMSRALVHAVRNPKCMAAMAMRGQQVVLNNYDWTIMAQRLESAWRGAVSETSVKCRAEC